KITMEKGKVSGSSFEEGSHDIVYTARDSGGQRDSCRFLVTIDGYRQPAGSPGSTSCQADRTWTQPLPACEDYEAPKFPDGCPPDQEVFSGPLGSAVNVSWVEPKVTDNSGQHVTLHSDHVSGAQFGPGTHIIKITATDSVGNNASCVTAVTVRNDFQTICPLDCDQDYAVRDGPGSIQCLANATWSIAGSCQDVEPPVFVECPENFEVYGSRLGEETQASWALPRVTDNSGKHVQLTSNHNPGETFPTGVTRVTYTATDVSGNVKLCQFSVTVTSLVCQPPDLEPQNRTNNIMLYDCPDGYVFGAKCGLSCSYGYPLLGADTIACDGDNSSYPPNFEWVWTSKRKPECIANNCTELDAPANGALSCNLGNFGWDCLMSCNEHWDVPAHFSGHFYCTNSKTFWQPSILPNCTIRITPIQPRLHSSLFYYTGDCNTSLEELKVNFVTRMKSSSTLKDAGHFLRRSRQAEQNIVVFNFDIAVDVQTVNISSSEFYQELQSLKTKISNGLKEEAEDGHFNIGNLVADRYSFAEPTVQADCPPGTIFAEPGCGAGHYLPDGSTKCEECPVGSYSELDNATSCTPCPPGWSTLTAGSPSRSSCKGLCSAGSKSTDGYAPCQACPPGTYQSRAGATTCDVCPNGTWTVSERTASQDQCIQHGGFGQWSSWTVCSASCGGGFKSRQRLCDGPSPAHGGNPCVGDFKETVECNTGECPVCSKLTHSNTTVLECNETTSPYLITCNLTCSTGFVSTMDFPLYTCEPKLAKEATMTQSVTMNTGCDGHVASSVPSQVLRNSAMLPCMKENSCAAKITTSCEDSTNGSGTGKSLVVHYELTVRFDSNVTEAENETATYYKYAEFIRMADESVGMLVQNDTEEIYTVEVGGEHITPDLSAVMYRAFIACPEGTVTTGGICSDCPAGYKEENGECVPCRRGQYQDQPGSTYCKLCPEGKFWDVLGAVSIDQCIC
ncbi:hypothetical protein BaRGS_00033162, partial [Batillaria attramentaria]